MSIFDSHCWVLPHVGKTDKGGIYWIAINYFWRQRVMSFLDMGLSTWALFSIFRPEWIWRVHRQMKGKWWFTGVAVIHVGHKLSDRWSIVVDIVRVRGPHGRIMVAAISPTSELFLQNELWINVCIKESPFQKRYIFHPAQALSNETRHTDCILGEVKRNSKT